MECRDPLRILDLDVNKNQEWVRDSTSPKQGQTKGKTNQFSDRGFRMFKASQSLLTTKASLAPGRVKASSDTMMASQDRVQRSRGERAAFHRGAGMKHQAANMGSGLVNDAL